VFLYPKKYDVIVVGGGHAGIEAALASSRMGCCTLMLTMNADTIGQMSCNPAIGGLAKGHLAREIDAFGGEMGICTDMTGLQFRMLNTKKGPAVRAPRAQCDKKAYQFRMKWICERESNLDVTQGQVARLVHKAEKITGVETTMDVRYEGSTVVITTGTFLKGLMHVGSNKQSGGRTGEGSVGGFSESLRSVGLKLGRLKTGTPPRLLKRSIDFSKAELQTGDEPIPYFSFWKEDLFHVEHSGVNPKDIRHSAGKYPPGSILDRVNGQIPCYITFTSDKTSKMRIFVSLFATLFLIGIWHGAGWNFVIYGIIHGFYVSIDSAVRSKFQSIASNVFFKSKIGKIISILATQYLIFLSFLSFRIHDLESLKYSIQKFVIFDFQTDGISSFVLEHKLPLCLMILFVILHFVSYNNPNLRQRIANLKLSYWIIFLTIMMIAIIFFYDANPRDFIYFKF